MEADIINMTYRECGFTQLTTSPQPITIIVPTPVLDRSTLVYVNLFWRLSFHKSNLGQNSMFVSGDLQRELLAHLNSEMKAAL